MVSSWWDLLLLLLPISFLLLLLIRYALGRRLQLTYALTPRNEHLLSQCPLLSSIWYPSPCLVDPALESYAFTIRARPIELISEREFIQAEHDGEFLVLDWVSDRVQSKPSDAVIIILHGITGHSEQPCMQRMSWYFSKEGYTAVVFNRRGCHVDAPLSCGRTYAYGDIEDFAHVCRHVRNRRPHATRIFAIGLSCGGNILTNYLGKYGDKAELDAGLCIGNGFDIPNGVQRLHWFWDRLLLLQLRSFFVERHRHTLSDHKDIDLDQALYKSRSSWEFDEYFSRRLHGFANIHDFYTAQSSLHSVDGIRKPFLILNASTDPVVDPSLLPLSATKSNPNLIFALSRSGGHIGFFRGLLPLWSRTYMEDLGIEWFRACSDLM